MSSQFQSQYRKLADEIISKYNGVFTACIDKLLSANDQVLVLLANYVMSSRNISSFLESVRNRDSLGIEHHYRSDLPVWDCMGSNKYVKVIAKTQEVLYQRFTYEELSTYRNNSGVRLKKDTDTFERVSCLAEDGTSELQVLRQKPGYKFNNLRAWQLFSEMTGVIWRCNHFCDYYYTRARDTKKERGDIAQQFRQQ